MRTHAGGILILDSQDVEFSYLGHKTHKYNHKNEPPKGHFYASGKWLTWFRQFRWWHLLCSLLLFPHGIPNSRQIWAKWLYASFPFQITFKTNFFKNSLWFQELICCALIFTQHFALPSSERPPSPFTVGPRTPGLHKLGPWKTSKRREKRDTWWKQGEGCLGDGVFQHSDGAKS